ncbi:hypothetical protein TrVFT333_011125 [Trichoderma virens FT-333]|nr:hypothetical protein TrVFT333_011125 [Trichoderma virens FT-333]
MSQPTRCGDPRQRVLSIDRIRSAKKRKLQLEFERERKFVLEYRRCQIKIERERELLFEMERTMQPETEREIQLEREREVQLEREREVQLEREREILLERERFARERLTELERLHRIQFEGEGEVQSEREREIQSERERLAREGPTLEGLTELERLHTIQFEREGTIQQLVDAAVEPLSKRESERILSQRKHIDALEVRSIAHLRFEMAIMEMQRESAESRKERERERIISQRERIISEGERRLPDPISVARSCEEAIKNAALTAHLVDEMVFRTMNDQSIMSKPETLLIEDLPTDYLPPWLRTNATRTDFVTVGYSKLNTSQKQIRLFELYPSINGSDIKGSFHYVELSANLEYVALSYTWGDEATYGEIQVDDGMNIPIRENLWQFLRLQSSSLSESKFYWIDAICINQSDVNERNHQVGLMRQIYTNATAVYVWLGCESSNSNLAMDYITEKASKKLKAKGLGFRPIWSEQEGEALVELCERPYWRRMWIIQEIISAENIVVWCGTRSFGWGLIIQLYQKLKVLESTHWLTHHAFAMRVFQSSAGVIIWQRAYWRHPDTPTPTLKTLINYSKSIYGICQDVWEKDAQNDAHFYNMLARVLGLRGEQMELGQHSPRYMILRQKFLSAKQRGVLTEEDDDDI